MAAELGKAWATLPVEVPEQHLAYYCTRGDRRQFVEYKTWQPEVFAAFRATGKELAVNELADETLSLLAYADHAVMPTQSGVETLLQRRLAARSIKEQAVRRGAMHRCLQRLRKLPSVDLKTYMAEENNALLVQRLLGKVDLVACFPHLKHHATVEAHILQRLRQGNFSWFYDDGNDQQPADRFGDATPSMSAAQHRKLLALAVSALHSGDDGALHDFLGLPSGPRHDGGLWPEVLQPESVLAGLTLSFFKRRSLQHCAAGVLACMKHARAAVIRTSEDVAILVMDSWKRIADDAMAKWRPYNADDGEDGSAATRAALANEIFLLPQLQRIDVVKRKVRYDQVLPLSVALEIEAHARNRVVGTLLQRGVSEDVAAAWYQLLEAQLHAMQLPRANLLSHLDVGSDSPPCAETRIVRFGSCRDPMQSYGLRPSDYFRYVTMRSTDLLSLATLYVECDENSQFVDDPVCFWRGLHLFEQRFHRQAQEASGSHALLRGSLGRCGVVCTCPRCGSTQTVYRDRQTHAADEEHTYDIFCKACGHASEPQL